MLLVLEDVLAHCELACHGGWLVASARRHICQPKKLQTRRVCISCRRQDGLTGSAWGDWANYTASPLRAFESELGVQDPVGFFDPAGQSVVSLVRLWVHAVADGEGDPVSACSSGV